MTMITIETMAALVTAVNKIKHACEYGITIEAKDALPVILAWEEIGVEPEGRIAHGQTMYGAAVAALAQAVFATRGDTGKNDQGYDRPGAYTVRRMSEARDEAASYFARLIGREVTGLEAADRERKEQAARDKAEAEAEYEADAKGDAADEDRERSRDEAQA